MKPFLWLCNWWLRNHTWRHRTVGHTEPEALGWSIMGWSPFVKIFSGLKVLDTSFRSYRNLAGFIFSLSARLFLKKFCTSGNWSRAPSAGGSTLKEIKNNLFKSLSFTTAIAKLNKVYLPSDLSLCVSIGPRTLSVTFVTIGMIRKAFLQSLMIFYSRYRNRSDHTFEWFWPIQYTLLYPDLYRIDYTSLWRLVLLLFTQY